MHETSIEEIANAVLYEGYLLYPYRASAVKNQRRFNFGVLTPQSYSDAQRGSEAFEMQTECLIRAGTEAEVEAKVRFLQLCGRTVRAFDPPVAEWNESAVWQSVAVDALEANGETYSSFAEAAECEVLLESKPSDQAKRTRFSFGARQEFEPVRGTDGKVSGVIVRTRHAISGTVELEFKNLERDLFRLTLRVSNDSSFDPVAGESREDALRQALISLHAILRVRNGEFVSMLEPPDDLRKAAAACRNSGWWPVLAGKRGSRDAMLSSPIILYDYPEIAAESAGELFDGTEIDEILTLRIMTLTDQEKEEMRQGDERARRILERTEAMTPEDLMKLHGVLRRPRAFES